MYNNFIGTLFEPNDDERRILEEREPLHGAPEHDYDRVRFGMPHGTVKYDRVQEEVKILIDHYFNFGYGTWPYTKLSSSFRKHVAKFRASLDLWEQFSQFKVFSKDEIYVRCLREGHAFTEFIKKARATCLRGKTSETDTDIEEEYYFDEYTGYDSIINERYLIHWDDTEEVDDVKYAFIPQTRNRDADFEEMLDAFWEDFSLHNIDWPVEFDMIGALKNTKMYDPIKKKTFLMREFWDKKINPSDSYFAKRSVVPTTPGKTRDTGVGDPSTVLKVKQLNMFARAISEHVPYSANAPAHVCNARLKRVLKKNLFLHLDFKKFGLTFPRRMLNILIRKIGKESGIDVSHLIIENFTIEIDGTCYHTERGTVLGWLDSINSLVVSVILHDLSKRGLEFDFITFNDDVEISKRGVSAPKETLELLRLAVIAELDSFDIPISMGKTYGSRASVFLERYAYYTEEYGLDMYKEQLTVDAYAKSLVTEFPWQAKLFFAAANQWTKSQYATDRCINTCPVEFRKEENTLPLYAGGWFIFRSNGKDDSLEYSDRLGLRLGTELQKFRPPKYSTKRDKVSSNKKISEKTNSNVYRGYSAGMARHLLGADETIETLNEELESLVSAALTRVDTYPGRNANFAEAVHHVLVERVRAVHDPGGQPHHHGNDSI
jgi:hypothetical protein